MNEIEKLKAELKEALELVERLKELVIYLELVHMESLKE